MQKVAHSRLPKSSKAAAIHFHIVWFTSQVLNVHFHLQSRQQALQGQAATGSLEPDTAADMGRRAQQGLRKAADRAQRAAEGSPKAERQAVVQYAQDLAVDVQGFVATEVVQKQLQIMSVCFEGLCLEVSLNTTIGLAACLMVTIGRITERSCSSMIMFGLNDWLLWLMLLKVQAIGHTCITVFCVCTC